MLKLPGRLTPETFLADYWQQQPLFMPAALERLRPAVTRNELAWLATLDDVESRIVFTDRQGESLRYRAESGPFDAETLAALPRRDWTLLVHDVEKHLPAMRKLFALIPFVPDWRCDDLMVSFAAPGGGVGPHRDHYDVFLCQGIGVREWRVSTESLAPDPDASEDLALLEAFTGTHYEVREGDVLYIPPGVAHWGTARRACLTYSLGMRAPQVGDLAETLPDQEQRILFYEDPDLTSDEARPGWISDRAVARATALLDRAGASSADVAKRLGECATATKQWLTPDAAEGSEVGEIVNALRQGATLEVHGMARIAYSRRYAFVNGRALPLPEGGARIMAAICEQRRLQGPLPEAPGLAKLVLWMLEAGAFEIPGNL